MKKLFSLLILSAVTMSVTFGATNEWKSFKKAVRNDIHQTHNAYRDAARRDAQATREAIRKDAQETHDAYRESIRKDIEADRNARYNALNAKKADKIREIDKKIYELNKEKAQVQNDKKMSYTEKTMRTRSIQRKIDFYNNQKASL